MAWFISDTHFNHLNIIKYCNRPFSNVKEMNEHIINQWNSVVKNGDKVYHLGDFALYSDKEIISELVSKLNGDIVLILGNHDKRSKQYKYKKQWYLDCGFVEVYRKLRLGRYILTHRPLMLDELKNKINIHGHVHNYTKKLDGYINVSCEVIDYTPMWIDTYN